MPAEYKLEARTFYGNLSDFQKLANVAEPQELQTLLRLAVKRMEWDPDGKHKVQFYPMPLNKDKNQRPPLPNSQERGSEGRWFDLNKCSDTSGRGRTDTPLRELDFESSASANSATEATVSSLGANPWATDIKKFYPMGTSFASLFGASLKKI